MSEENNTETKPARTRGAKPKKERRSYQSELAATRLSVNMALRLLRLARVSKDATTYAELISAAIGLLEEPEA